LKKELKTGFRAKTKKVPNKEIRTRNNCPHIIPYRTPENKENKYSKNKGLGGP
jgi:hypothetical protein